MKAEIIAVGSELLLGQITNTNAAYLSQQLSQLGVDVYYHTVVGDNAERLAQAIRIAQQRADLLIFTGGLGPTKDDLTKHTIANELQLPLVIDQDALTSIEQFFANHERPMTENNRQQALVLNGCTVLKNHNGMAPGMYVEKGEHHYLLFPGPPRELHMMFEKECKPLLAKKIGQGEQIISHVFRFYGIGEAALESELQDLLDAQTNPTIAPLASDGEVCIRLTAKAANEDEAYQFMQPVADEIKRRVGHYIYGENEATLQSSLVSLLKEKGFTISAAESLTAGLFTAMLTEVSGVSSVLVGSVVTYATQSKIEQLSIEEALIAEHGVVSQQCAEAMASQVAKKFQTTIGVGLTGVAGPGPQDGVAEGTVWLGFSINGVVKSVKLQLKGERNLNRVRAVKFAYSYLIKQLKTL